MKADRLIVGLGNPGKEYAETRHNAGFMALESLRQAWAPEKDWQEDGKCQVAWLELELDHIRIALIRPLGFINKSGAVLAEFLRYQGFGLDDAAKKIIVLHDDSDIVEGRLKIVHGSGAAGHKGVADILNHLGTQKIARVRFGVRPENEGGRAENFVLTRVSKESQLFERLMEAPSIVERLIKDGPEECVI